jgi:hypothetical protein
MAQDIRRMKKRHSIVSTPNLEPGATATNPARIRSPRRINRMPFL